MTKATPAPRTEKQKLSRKGLALSIVPSLPARQLADGRVRLTRKFVEGTAEYKKHWHGPLSVFMAAAKGASTNLDEIDVDPRDLPFDLHVRPSAEIPGALIAEKPALSLLSLDDCNQSTLGADCRAQGITCAYISEYNLATRIQIADAAVSNPLRRIRKRLWESGQERRRRKAVAQADGLQCNGTPTWNDYRALCGNVLLFFDSRVTEDLLAHEEKVFLRHAEFRATGKLRLLFSGRLARMKGTLDLIEVARQLRRRNVNFSMSICGDGELAGSMLDTAKSSGLSAEINFKGVLDFRSELMPFAKANADLFVCCHPQGDPSCTYLETMSCGVPIAGYANEAFVGVAKESGSGWTTPLGNPSALADQIAALSNMPGALLTSSLVALRFAKQHTMEQTFSRRVKHLQALLQ